MSKPNITVDSNINSPEAIVRFLHCKKCLEEKPADLSPRDYIRMEAGLTAEGLQVWCIRHELEIAHVKFFGEED